MLGLLRGEPQKLQYIYTHSFITTILPSGIYVVASQRVVLTTKNRGGHTKKSFPFRAEWQDNLIGILIDWRILVGARRRSDHSIHAHAS